MRAIVKFFKTVFSGAAHLLALCLKIAYNILKALKIRILTLYLAACGCAQWFFRAFDGGNAVWFWTGFALCCALTLTAWAVFLLRYRKRAERKRMQEEETEEELPCEPVPTEEDQQGGVRYFTVKGHENFYFAEYDDRYELYEKRREGDRYIRTDYKRE